MFCKKSREDERRYAYEKAIEAYWKHVDRYHTWMNYYALFNGALFVGFCTLLCATNLILAGKSGYEIENLTLEGEVVWLKNDYGFLQIVLCGIGLISAIAWCGSILGHEKWEKNWMNIITFYEDIGVYSILVTKSDSELSFDGIKNIFKQFYFSKNKIDEKDTMKNKTDKKDEDNKECHTLKKGYTFKAYSTHNNTSVNFYREIKIKQ